MVASAMLLSSCGNKKQAQPAQQTAAETLSGLNPANFADTIDGKPTALYTLKNASGAEVCITNLGARIVSIWVPDRYGEFKDVVLGFDNVKAYANRDGKTPSDFGAAIGRYANRIGGGKFTLDGVEYVLPQNNYGHCRPSEWPYRPDTASL